MDAKKIISGLIIAVIVVVTGIVAYNYGSNRVVVRNSDQKAKQAASGFIDALVKGNVDETYSFGSTAYQAKNTKERVKAISDSLKSDKPQVAEEEIFFGQDEASNSAIYLSSVSNLPPNSFDRTTGNFVVRLTVEGGKWKVDSLQVY